MSEFLSPNLETFLVKLDALSADQAPEWGSMNAQQMVEHLSNSLDVSIGKIAVELVIPEEHVAKSLEYLHSEKPFPRGFKIEYAPENPPLRNESIEDAIDELSMKWIEFEEYYEVNPEAKHLQPVYGMLDYDGWLRAHSKHFTHHFAQFGL